MGGELAVNAKQHGIEAGGVLAFAIRAVALMEVGFEGVLHRRPRLVELGRWSCQ